MGSAPTQSEIPNHQREDDNPGALIKKRGPLMIKDGDQTDAEKDAGSEEWEPEQWPEKGSK